MSGLGQACLFLGLLVALYAVGAGVAAGRSGRAALAVSARRAVYCIAALLALALVVLEVAYLSSDFSFALVAESSSTTTPTFYKVTGMWSTQAGSLLLWASLLAFFASAALFVTRRGHREVAPYATAVLAGVAAFFLAIMVFIETPFATLATVPAEGAGLNPLLRHPAMMIHPPMLYTGYVGFSIPFAFAIGALITRRTGAEWIRSTRRFSLLAWTFLGAGIMLGSLWSYSELGWGGYWGWDAVENASLMPWLVGTAFIHSIIVQEKRGMLRVWNVSLVIAAFVLALLGTFLVRSGILESIHAFGASTLGVPFLIFISVVLAGSVALVVSRRDDLRSEGRVSSLLSRESVFLLNNLVLVGLCFLIFWGTFFPLISEALNGTEASLGASWFSTVTPPLALVLVALTGLGMSLAWRRTTPARLRRGLLVPLAVTLVVLAVLLAFTPAAESPGSLVMFALAALVVTVAVQELVRGARVRRAASGESWPRATAGLVSRNRRRYGGYLAHVGIVVAFVGVAASSAFDDQQTVRLDRGETIEVGGYSVTYREATASVLADPSGTGAPVTLGAVLDVRRGDESFVLRPSRNYYAISDPSAGPVRRFFEGEPTSEVDVRWGLLRDVWSAVEPDLSGLEDAIREGDELASQTPEAQGLIVATLAESYRSDPPPADFRLIASPLVVWLWVGGLIVLLGALLAFSRVGSRRPRRAAPFAPARDRPPAEPSTSGERELTRA